MKINEFSQDIVEQAKSLDSNAIAVVFEYYYPKLYRYFYYRVRIKEDAEDLASEVFVKMVKSIKRQTGNFAAWLYMIAKNTLVDYYRREGVKIENTVDNTILETVPDDKKAVEGKYGVAVSSVNILNTKPKAVRLGRIEGVRPGYKKAIVTLVEGDKIEIGV